MSINDAIQYTLSSIIIATAIFAAVRTIYRTLRNKKTALNNCAGCKLNAVCKKTQHHTNTPCDASPTTRNTQVQGQDQD